MEEQLAALGLGFGASVAEQLYLAREPQQWSELHDALKGTLGSKGTLTKTLTRMVDAGIVVKSGQRYALLHPDRVAAVLAVGADLNADVLAVRSQAAGYRARHLRKSAMVRQSPRAQGST
jgi:DNA-binding HxlR family transcriptional regulator